ncbi:MAG: B12-binding domain-containing radical SAM protein [Clostridiales bacterium]|nr:B12-binding domain-containing radical SAM protein [Clostridiales bacterium]
MKILLMTLNSKFIHSNLAIKYIERFWRENHEHDHQMIELDVKEYTINNDMDHILRDIHKGRYDAVFASAYIWNIDPLSILFSNFRKINPKSLIIFGGPEVSYDPVDQLAKHSYLDGVICGEGEQTFSKLLIHFSKEGLSLNDVLINGMTTRFHPISAEVMKVDDLDSIPFPYINFNAYENRIVYYESSRGCPYSCSYCLSAASKGVRYFSLERVFGDLDIFLEAKIPQVKFVDRTFNINKKHALPIMEYLVTHDNGITNFHFEITADLLDDDYFNLISKARHGLFQFEIGIQSTNQPTTVAINRPIPFDTLKEKTQTLIQIEKAHVHVDLIAGLPHENFERFLLSFDEVFEIGADQLQLGFLKLLKGTPLYNDKDRYDYTVRMEPPFEVLENKFISFDELTKLKEMEKLVEWFYNSKKFHHSIHYFINKSELKPGGFFLELASYFILNGYFDAPISTYRLYEILSNYYSSKYDDIELFKDLLKFDYYASNLKGQRELFHYEDLPRFNQNRLEILKNDDFVKSFNTQYLGLPPKQILKNVEFITLKYDIMALIQSNYKSAPERLNIVMFDYDETNMTLHGFKAYKIKREEFEGDRYE